MALNRIHLKIFLHAKSKRFAFQHLMLTKIKRQTAINTYPNLPLRHYDLKEDEYVFNFPKVFANYILTVPSKSYKGHIKLLAAQIVLLASHLGYNQLIFLGDLEIAWLRRYKEYDIFEEALQYLIDNKVGKRFNGALQVDISQLPIFFKHLAWLVRTNGVLPYIHFIDPGQNIIGNICQYGNLHISTRTELADRDFKNAIAKSNLSIVTDGNCYNKFSKSGAIKGRTITV